MKLPNGHHLAYCTNVHPAESWEETFNVLKTEVLAVRDELTKKRASSSSTPPPFAIGLRLSAQAARELLEEGKLAEFALWLKQTNTYVFTINGFPYGDFHGTRVKEKVYQPDWTTSQRVEYTCQLFAILAEIGSKETGISVSTLPGSFKEFGADENFIFASLYTVATYAEHIAVKNDIDVHLGLEPEPIGHFENTTETIAFFHRFENWATSKNLSFECVRKRIGVNYDTCHFALEFDDCHSSLEAFRKAGIRISKVHLSSALEFNPTDLAALEFLKSFDEPTYLHQVIIQNRNEVNRIKDLPQFFTDLQSGAYSLEPDAIARCHFHVPLYAEAAPPLATTQHHAQEMLMYRKANPEFCQHFEIETYTWGVLPESLQTDLTSMIVREYEWVLERIDL